MRYALPQKAKYPIDTKEQVKTAALYFNRYVNQFHPAERAAMAQNLEKRASELGIGIDSANIHNYSRPVTAPYSPDFDLHMSMRKTAAKGIRVIVGGKEVDAGDVMNKVACLKETIEPAKMVELLHDLDKKAGLEGRYDTHIRDPYFTVFGSNSNPRYSHEKIAAGIYTDALGEAAANNEAFMSKLAEAFGKDFADSFKEDPENIYKSMPGPEKEIILNALQES